VKPDAARFLEVAAAHVALRTGPALGSGYEQSTMMVLAAMLICMREEFDRAAARRVEENRELRRIFGAAVGVVEEPTLRAALERAAGRGDESLAVPDLEESIVRDATDRRGNLARARRIDRATTAFTGCVLSVNR
jgi:hypothetical protein